MARKPSSDARGYGKVPAKTMEGVVYRNLGARRSEVVMGPGKGLDNAVITLPGGKLVVVTADPVSFIPGLGARLSAWLSVHLVASDFTTSGVAPQFATFTFNFPQVMTQGDRVSYLKEVGRACAELGVAIVAGHTGAYPGASLTVIGGGTMFGLAKKGGYVVPSMARVGDVILMTKGAAIEATASLSNAFPRYTADRVGGPLTRKARDLVTSSSTVKDALAAATVGLGRDYVTSMHDATEGGVLGSLEEMASACKKSFEVQLGEIEVYPEASAVCSAFGLDPLRTMGEGALLLTCHPARVGDIRRRLSREGLPVAEIGMVKAGDGLWVSGFRSRKKRFRPATDRYWAAYERAFRTGAM